MTMFDDTAAQVMQMLGLSLRPSIGRQLSCTAVGGRQSVGYGIEVDGLERPTLKREGCIIEIARNPIAQALCETCRSRFVAHFGQPCANGIRRCCGERQVGLA